METPAPLSFPKIRQKTLTIFKSFRAGEDCLFVDTKNLREELSYTVRYEELGFDLIRKRNKAANIPFYCFLVFDGLYLWLLITAVLNQASFGQQAFWAMSLLFFTTLTIAAFYNRNKETIYLSGGTASVELLAAKPDALAVQSFIDNLHAIMRVYFRKKYFMEEMATPVEIRLQQLKWLRNTQSITESEYLANIQRINGYADFPVQTRDN